MKYPISYSNRYDYNYDDDYQRIDENVNTFNLLKTGNDEYLEQIKEELRGD